MKRQRPYHFAFFLMLIFSLGFARLIQAAPSLSYEPHLMINNQPLAKIHGKVISLCDVVKKMDLFLFEHYPKMTPSPVEKYQFYMSRWKPTLDEMIDNELILLDAEQKEIKISDGQVREELEEKFGPNVMSTLHQLNYDYEQAREMIRQDLTIQQLIGMKVHSKAFQKATPQAIKDAYETYLEKNPPYQEWTYQVLSIRGKDKTECEKIAQKAYDLLEKEKEPIENIPSRLEANDIVISLSDDYRGDSQKLSKMHFDVIQALSPHSYSPPVAQVSRYDRSIALRIFYLKDMIKTLPETFEKMHDTLKNELLYEFSYKEKEAYIQSLKKRFGYQNHSLTFELPSDYEPFAIL